MKLIDRFVSRELIVNLLFAICRPQSRPRRWQYFSQAPAVAGES